ncbi:ArnT family glycosyltransferase [Lutimonas vermicola]|uniref:Glycosyltransferase family 39 protein n=1 Tax=Lutimonas vermicola TaxID=414288 RepID=A0ABU9L317_9FLAO
MKRLKNPKIQFFSILLLFFVINVLQSRFTNLFEDEAYYYVWSKNLAFGYFDHPPMVALWAFIGQLLADGELGLRLLSTISFCLMIWIIWTMVDYKEKWRFVLLFFLVVISLTLWQVFGFIITPDTPLLLFTSLFLLSYKRFLDKESTLNIVLLGFSMAAMLYSKYHGILVIVFVVVSHLKLLKNPRFWMAGLLGLVLFIPHLNWQYQNGFPSFEYHLKERGKKPYSILNNLTHLVNMIAVVGLTFPVVYKAFFKQKTTGVFAKSLKFIIYGFFIFFFISSFKSEPQAQWVILILIPLALIIFPYFIEHPKARKWLVILGSIQLGLLLIIRIFLAFPSLSPIELEPHVSQQWIPDLKTNTEGRPVVFVNSYRNASLYNFYTGIKTHSYSILKGRKSQYNLLDFEANMQGEDIYSANSYVKNQPKLAKRYSSFIYGKLIPDYQTFEKVICRIETEALTFHPGTNQFEFRFINTYDKNITFDQVRFVGVFQGYKNRIIAKVPLQVVHPESLMAKKEKVMRAVFEAPEIPQNEAITFRVALEFYNLLEGFQGNKVAVTKTNK